MNITSRAALLAAYYPFQLRVNAVLLENNIINSSTVYMSGFPTLCVETCLQEPVRTDIGNMEEPFDQIQAFNEINDQELTTSVLLAWDKLKDLINPPISPEPVVVTSDNTSSP